MNQIKIFINYIYKKKQIFFNIFFLVFLYKIATLSNTIYLIFFKNFNNDLITQFKNLNRNKKKFLYFPELYQRRKFIKHKRATNIQGLIGQFVAKNIFNTDELKSEIRNIEHNSIKYFYKFYPDLNLINQTKISRNPFNLELIYNKTVETEYLDSNRLWNIDLIKKKQFKHFKTEKSIGLRYIILLFLKNQNRIYHKIKMKKNILLKNYI